MVIKEMVFATAYRIDWLFSDPIYWSPVLFIVAVMALLFSEAMRD